MADSDRREPKPIKALDVTVVNRIAAGEIIQRPANALKELIENSIDAGSTSIDVVVKEGGVKLLQITDNGCGIRKEDMEILCERFTTSKLQKFDDLSSIATYGFRGEALASISHIAHVTITTKTAESPCAWRATYSDGKLVPAKPGQSADPKPVAGKTGTQITAEDLFYNVPTRRRAFRNANDEYMRLLDVVQRYAVHSAGISMSCKRHGDTAYGCSTVQRATTKDNIRQIYGASVAGELLSVEVKDEGLAFKVEGLVTNANYHVKKTTMLLFINHRLVESTSLKRGLEQIYATFLPKGGHPFIYLSLEIEPSRVDVNVHPTKREVNFLYEEEIVECICQAVDAKLREADSSRRFEVQTLLPGVKELDAADKAAALQKTQTKVYEKNMVRTDSRAQTITSFLSSTGVPSGSSESQGPASSDTPYEYEHTEKTRTNLRLASMKELKCDVRDQVHNGLSDLFANHTWVGLVDEKRRLAAVQHTTKLYLIDYGAVSCELFYQIGLTEFGNYGSIRLQPPLNLKSLLKAAMEVDEGGDTAMEDDERALDRAEVVQAVHEQLVSKREMLGDYFSIELSEDGEISSIPLLIKGYVPSLAKLPGFLLRLGPNVDWYNEKACFETFLRELAIFYAPEPIVKGSDEKRSTEVRAAIEKVLFPAFKKRLVATKNMLVEKRVIEIANLPALYRVFERC
ncbi:hypothetical protein G7K_3496-t1 [Saitoella complicata NRRL Y-17804]|uniref:DNA mismatch repair protein S5 domain-containing protein n=1 Tax=Saitoella complicata (strain BCRC 22490 / CBS 7301 / JCM 7358 / NBRC 10748 / NRRL Y-17804) TaxID=698492 RepID=A0A0E9NIV9_SAICN|nr:hypothetical protein G7K_3496-t1 [Saitoella complicata NRRL Y-17804]